VLEGQGITNEGRGKTMPITTEDLEAINAMEWHQWPNGQGWDVIDATEATEQYWEVLIPGYGTEDTRHLYRAFLYDGDWPYDTEVVAQGVGYTRQQAIANAR